MLNPFCIVAKSQWAKCIWRIGAVVSRSYCSGSHKENVQQQNSTEPSLNVKGPETIKTAKGGGFAEAMAKFEGHESFTKMLRKSPLVQMGDPQGKIVEGKIIHVVNDDLYIDFGTKFNCVCPRPSKNGSSYTLGKKVRLVIHDLELSTRFLGASTDLTILEADCTLIGLASKQENESVSSQVLSTTVE